MQSNIVTKRIIKEQKAIRELKSDTINIQILDNNLFELHFTFKGEPNTIFENGYYHGAVFLPSNYPFSAPDVIFYTVLLLE